MESTIKKERPSKKSISNQITSLKPTVIKKNNLRIIEPYEFKYQLYVKGRWVGRKLLNVLETEFLTYTHEYFVSAISSGKIKINNTNVPPDYKLKRNDFLTHATIRKENPIIDEPLEILCDDDDYLVVNKPSSWPVHVCSGYLFNTLQRILHDEYNYDNLKILHRLDKHTSGVVIFAKNKDIAEKFRQKLHTDQISKTYLARVRGDFKYDKIKVERYLMCVNKGKGIYTDISNEEAEKIINENKKIELNRDGTSKKIKKHKDGSNINENEDEEDIEFLEPKNAITEFEKLFYDLESNTSVVYCRPITGRTHQIRIHLRFLGFPIANDPCYGGIIYNDIEGFNGCIDNEELNEYQFSEKFNAKLKMEKEDKENKEDKEHEDIKEETKEVQINEINTDCKNENNEDLKEDKNVSKNESDINSLSIKEQYININTPLISVSDLYCYKIWLHAYTYKFEDKEFKTSVPKWAEKDYKLPIKF